MSKRNNHFSEKKKSAKNVKKNVTPFPHLANLAATSSKYVDNVCAIRFRKSHHTNKHIWPFHVFTSSKNM